MLSQYVPLWHEGYFELKQLDPADLRIIFSLPQFSSFPKLCVTLCDCSTPGLPVPHHLPEFTQVHVHCISDAIQASHPLPPSSTFSFNLSQNQGLFQ